MGGAPGGGKQENSCGARSRGGALGPRALVVSGAVAHPGRPVSELEGREMRVIGLDAAATGAVSRDHERGVCMRACVCVCVCVCWGSIAEGRTHRKNQS